MDFLKIVLITCVISVVNGSGYFPAIGGPWARYTTTTPNPNAVPGFNLPATEAPPPPEVTFVPRPQNPSQSQFNENNNLGSTENNNRFPSYGQGTNSNNVNSLRDFYVISDPVTGEQFLIPKQSFWNQFANRGVQAQGRRTSGYNREYMYNNDLQTRNSPRLQRVRRALPTSSLESSEESHKDLSQMDDNESDDIEDRHIDQVNDDEYEYDVPESEEQLGNGYRRIALLDKQYLTPSASEVPSELNMESEEDQRFKFQSTSDIFKLFFPSISPNFGQGKYESKQPNQMIYTYTLFRAPCLDKEKIPSTTSATTTTSTTSSTTTTTTQVPVTTPKEVEETTISVVSDSEKTEIPTTHVEYDTNQSPPPS